MVDSKVASVVMEPLEKVGDGRELKWEVPGSKSITNRALILAALRDGETVLRGVLHSDDTRHMINALKAVGVGIEEIGKTSLRVHGGVARLRAPEKELFIGNSGTSVRFLTAFATLVPGDVKFVGDQHMAKRPIGDLVSALEQMGVEVDCPTKCPPITVKGNGLPGGLVKMAGTKSSQYFSALMLSGRFADKDMEIQVEGTLVSLPYVKMTMQMVHDFGGEIIHNEEKNSFTVKKVDSTPSTEPFEYIIEPDASSASYPFALAAAAGVSVTVPNLNEQSIQGDYGFVQVLKDMGCTVAVGKNHTTVTGPKSGTKLKGIEVDMHHISDTVMTLAAIAPLCDGPVHIKNVANIRIKETDRLFATVTELKRLGQEVEHGEDWLKIIPGKPITPAEIECYSDHRMAMCFAILGKVKPGITITDPACTAKTYPEFWQDIEKVCTEGSNIEEETSEPSTKKPKTADSKI